MDFSLCPGWDRLTCAAPSIFTVLCELSHKDLISDPKTLNSTAGTTPVEEPIPAVTRWVGCTLDRSPACCSANITLYASLKFLVYKISLAEQYLPICVSLGCGTSGWAVCWLYDSKVSVESLFCSNYVTICAGIFEFLFQIYEVLWKLSISII